MTLFRFKSSFNLLKTSVGSKLLIQNLNSEMQWRNGKSTFKSIWETARENHLPDRYGIMDHINFKLTVCLSKWWSGRVPKNLKYACYAEAMTISFSIFIYQYLDHMKEVYYWYGELELLELSLFWEKCSRLSPTLGEQMLYGLRIYGKKNVQNAWESNIH